jgi:predicted HicB family RNase H-like nuclease
VPKGVKDDIKAAADAAGQSVNAYILDAVRERMQR